MAARPTIALCLLAISLVAGSPANDNNARIIEGSSQKREKFPFVAALQFDKWFCSGTIISERFILTSAACIGDSKWVQIRVGDPDHHSKSDLVQFRNVTKTYMMAHSDWEEDSWKDDIGAIRVIPSLQFNKEVQPKPIIRRRDVAHVHGRRVEIAGWGWNRPLDEEMVFHYADVTAIESGPCTTAWEHQFKRIDESQFCLNSEKNAPWVGDLGGSVSLVGRRNPLGSISDELIGIVSYFDLLEPKKLPPIITRISEYFDWIEQHTDIRIED